MIGAAVAAGHTFDEVDRMTLPQILFVANGHRFATPRPKFDSFEGYALWRQRL